MFSRLGIRTEWYSLWTQYSSRSQRCSQSAPIRMLPKTQDSPDISSTAIGNNPTPSKAACCQVLIQ